LASSAFAKVQEGLKMTKRKRGALFAAGGLTALLALAQTDRSLRSPTDPFQSRLQRAVGRKAPGGQPAAESQKTGDLLLQKYRARRDSEDSRARSASGGQGVSLGVARPTPDPCTTPQIKAVDATPPLDPGDHVVIQGCGFGKSAPNEKIELRLVGDFGVPGHPGPPNIPLDVSWSVGWKIVAQMPPPGDPRVKGVQDDPVAKLQVFRKDGKFSNWFQVGFRANRVVSKLGPYDVTFNCKSTSLDNCTLATSHPLADTQFFGGATVAARHLANNPPCGSGDPECVEELDTGREGSDVIAVSLKNGWTLAGYAWWWRYEIIEKWGLVEFPFGFPEGSSSASLSMKWEADYNCCPPKKHGGVSYRVDLWAIGPENVPYK
jgi:hypothetical protein